MNLSAPFIRRPVATTLLTIGVALAGAGRVLAAAGLAAAAGRLPDHLGAAPAARRQPGDDGDERGDAARARSSARIAGVTEMTSSSSRRHRRASRCSSTSTATSTAPRATCRRRSTPRAPTCRPACRSNPTYRKVNPADAPIMILALTSDTLTHGPDLRRGVAPSWRRSCRRSSGVGQVDGRRQLAAGGARRAQPARR